MNIKEQKTHNLVGYQNYKNNIMKKNNKQRLFEVMGRLDKTFKPINESMGDFNIDQRENLEYFLSFNNDDIYWKWINGEIDDYGAKEAMRDIEGMAYDPNVDYKKEYSSENESKLSENVAGKKTFMMNLWGEEDEVFFDLDTYANNDTMAVELVTTMGEPYATVSTNLPESEDLPEGEFFLKDWSENEPIAKALIDMGAIIPTGKSASSGFVVAKSYKINPEYL